MGTQAHIEHLNRCRFCDGDFVVDFLELSPLPITGAFLRTQDEDGFLFPIKLFVCENCGAVQTQHNISFADYYNEYSYTIRDLKFADNFAQILAKTICERCDIRPGSRVLEIGSGDGAQLSHFKALGMIVQGFEPSAVLSKVANENDIPTVKELYSLETRHLIPDSDHKFDLVLLTHVFDHLPSQRDFLQFVVPILDPDRGLLLIEVHNFEETYLHKEYCLFQHEHTVYPTAGTLQSLLGDFGLDIVDVGVLPAPVKRAHSLMIVATPSQSSHAARRLDKIPLGPAGDLAALRVFAKEVDVVIEHVRAFIQSRKARGQSLAAFGAGGRGIMTFAATAKPGDIAYICDSNPAHHGLYTPGARICVTPPSYADTHPVDEVIVCSYGYLDEIRAQLSGHIGRGGIVTSLLDILNGHAS